MIINLKQGASATEVLEIMNFLCQYGITPLEVKTQTQHLLVGDVKAEIDLKEAENSQQYKRLREYRIPIN